MFRSLIPRLLMACLWSLCGNLLVFSAVNAQDQLQVLQANSLPVSITISGRVTHGGDGVLTSGLQADLVVYDDLVVVRKETAQIEDGGFYRFSEVPVQEGWIYLVSVMYKDVRFYSDLLYAEELEFIKETNLPITVYESTSNTSYIKADSVQVNLDFSLPGMLRVTQSYFIVNPTRMVIIAEQQGMPVVEYSMPQEALDLSFVDGELDGRFVRTNIGVGDRQPIIYDDSQHMVIYSYTLPYKRKVSLDIILPVATRSFSLFVPVKGVRIKSQQLNDAGSRDLQGVETRLFTANNLEAGKVVNIQISGTPLEMEDPMAEKSLPIGLAVFSVAVIITAIVMSKRTKRIPQVEGAVDNAIDEGNVPIEYWLEQLASLEDLYRSGQIAKESYQIKRQALVEKLREVNEQN